MALPPPSGTEREDAYFSGSDTPSYSRDLVQNKENVGINIDSPMLNWLVAFPLRRINGVTRSSDPRLWFT
jgi:hypothetical protein